jgi:hypothetical protein
MQALSTKPCGRAWRAMAGIVIRSPTTDMANF